MSSLLNKVLGKSKPVEDREVTLPIQEKPARYTPPKAKPTYHVDDWNYSSAQSIGRIRDHNEDALFIQATSFYSQDTQKFVGLFMVADGMGGHANGEVASELAIRVMANQVIQNFMKPLFSEYRVFDAEGLRKILYDAVQEANQAVKKQVSGGGTTLTAILVAGDFYIAAHVGDSRLYILQSDQHIKAVTRDHSWVQQLVDIGHLSRQEAEVHPQRNILSMALGQWEPLEPDMHMDKVPEGGYILLCSDGLWGVVKDNEIEQMIRQDSSLPVICQNLIKAANQAGGPDNISIILIQVPTKQ